MADDVSHIFTDLEFSEDFEVRKEALADLQRRITEAPVDLQDALTSYVPDADPYQQRVIEEVQSTIRIVAPAGSGKTQTVINRVLFRIKKGVSPARILVLTFDNSAATSLKEKLNEQTAKLGVSVKGLEISTLNAFGFHVLREYVPKEFKQIVPKYRQRSLLKEVMDALKEKSPERHEELSSNVEYRYYLDFFSYLKNELFDPRNIKAQELADLMLKRVQAQPFFKNPQDAAHTKKVIQAIQWLFAAFELALQREKLIDFDDQKLRSYVCFSEKSGLLTSIQNKYAEIIVDEFQDINKLDFAFIKAIAEKAVLVVTGDDDQAIYGFRGCTPDYIIDLEKHLGRTVTSHELQINYRCPSNIVSHADRLIRNNKRRIVKQPIAHSKKLSTIKVVSTRSAGLEASTVVSFINKVKKANSHLVYKDFVVLYRTNAQSLPLQVEFVLKGIPYFVRKEDNILENDSLQRLLSVLRVKQAIAHKRTPSDQDAAQCVSAYFRYVSDENLGKLQRLFNRSADFVEALSSEDFYRILPKARNSSIKTAVQEVIDATSLLRTLDVLSKRFNGLGGMIGSLEDVVDQKVPLGEIYEVAANFNGNINDFVQTIESALEKARATNAGKDEAGGVGLLTYFKAKGRQWHTVILTTCNEGIIPHKKAPVEDERRLFYVAITRTSANLFISYVKKVCDTKVAPSIFLKEAGLI